jgi:hypothetical protein
MTTLYRIELRNITAGVVTQQDIIVKAAPVFHKFIGSPIRIFKQWVISKGGNVQKVSHTPTNETESTKAIE